MFELDPHWPVKTTWEEERIIEVKEMSEESSAHVVFLFFNYEL